MLTLAVDTTGDCGSIALADENGLRAEVLLEAPRGFSMVLFEALERLLTDQGVMLGDIELFAGASGPGSFTGVRVGLSAIKGLAETVGRPVVAVSNLEALADFGTAALRATVIDAHRNEVFAALYDDAGNQKIPEMVTAPERFFALLPEEPLDWISRDCAPARPEYRVILPPRGLASAVARIAIRRAQAGGAKDPAAIEANYVRRSDAELLWKEQ